MFAKNQNEAESKDIQGRRIKVGKLQAISDRFRELTSAEQKRVKGGIVISIIGVLVGGRTAPADQRQL